MKAPKPRPLTGPGAGQKRCKICGAPTPGNAGVCFDPRHR